MARIFISYRREDSEIWVSRLVDELCKHFPSDQIFQDVASIDPGADFLDVLDKALATAGVMLAVIGRDWLSATDRQGRRRLDLAGDFVRQEIVESLRRPGVRVFPLLVNGAEMPSEEELPEPLKPLYRRHAFELTVRHWNNDVAQLVQTLKRVPGLSEARGADQEAARQRTEEEAKRRGAEERAAQEEAERRAAELRKEAEEQARRKAEDEERQRVEEEARHKAGEEAARHKAEDEEEARKKAAEEEARRKAEDDELRRIEEETQQKAAEKKARRKAVEVQLEAKRKAAEREAQRRITEEEARRKAEEEERRRVEEEARQKAAEEEARRKAAEEESRRRAAREAAERKPPEKPGVPGSKFGWKAVAGVSAIVGAVTLLVVLSGREQRPSREFTPTPAPTVEPASVTPKTVRKAEVKPPETEKRRIVINGPKPLYAPFKMGDVFQECAECPEMVVIVPDAKDFTIGSPESEQGRQADEKQLGPIRFTKPYAIGKFEVTRAQFKASGVQPSGGCYTWDSKNSKWQPDPKRKWEQPGFDQSPDHPVVCVNWDEVQEYLKWINRQVGSSAKDPYRLPSEAEWEYAARAGTTTRYPWGDEPGTNRANINGSGSQWSGKQTAPVGSFHPNKFGLHDMIGNVWEWLQDCYAMQYSASIQDGSAFETQNCGRRVVRGGSWNYDPENARVAVRDWCVVPSIRYDNVGFRLARTL